MQIGIGEGATRRPALPIDVLGCELVPAGGGQELLRVTLTIQRSGPVRPADIRVVATDDRGRHVFSALPALPGRRQATFTIGFAIPSRLATTTLVLETGALRITLPTPTVRQLTPPPPPARPGQGEVLAAELRALDFATAAVRAESDRLELQAALARSQAELTQAQAQLAGVQVPTPAGELGRSGRTMLMLAAALSLLVAIVLAVSFGGSDSGTPARAAIAPAAPATAAVRQARLARRLGIPAAYLGLYRSAGRRYDLDWTILAAVGDVETGHGNATLPGVSTGSNGRGASGPAQFLSDTWEDYGIDGNGDGVRDRYDPADAIPAMASYLRASGAPLDWRGALTTYNHSSAYADEVLKRAQHYRRMLSR